MQGPGVLPPDAKWAHQAAISQNVQFAAIHWIVSFPANGLNEVGNSQSGRFLGMWYFADFPRIVLFRKNGGFVRNVIFRGNCQKRTFLVFLEKLTFLRKLAIFWKSNILGKFPEFVVFREFGGSLTKRSFHGISPNLTFLRNLAKSKFRTRNTVFTRMCNSEKKRGNVLIAEIGTDTLPVDDEAYSAEMNNLGHLLECHFWKRRRARG